MSDIRNYLFSRVRRDDYRGAHVAQHNRLPFDKAASLLSAIHGAVGEGDFPVPPGDDKGVRRPGFAAFYQLVDEIAENLGQGTVNSVKKNHFPDFARMGFLERMGRDGSVLSPEDRRPVCAARLTATAARLALAQNPREKYRLYLEAVERLIGPKILDELFAILHEDFESVSVHEFMLVLSDPGVSRTEKTALLKSHRRLSALHRVALRADIRAECELLSAAAADKRGKRDYGNWHNQALEIFNLLNQTVYFKTFKKTVLMLGFSDEALEFLAARSGAAKARALRWHGIEERGEYDLHHIVPLETAFSRKTLGRVDDHRNLLCLRKSAHRKIPTRNNLFVQLDASAAGGIFLTNPFDAKPAQMDVSGDVLCETKNLPEMVEYNRRLLNELE